MPLKIIHHHHTEVMGSGRVLLSSPHVESSRRDLQTRQIVEEAALLSKSWAIIAKGKQPVQIIQLELGPDERGFQKDHIVSVMADIVGLINGKLGFLESDQRGSRVLD